LIEKNDTFSFNGSVYNFKLLEGLMTTALSIKDLKLTYPNGLEALKGVNLEIEEGDFFALLGPNGAGKTTTINIITNLLCKTSGTLSVFGTDIDKDINLAKTYIGVVPQEFNFNIFETVFDIVVQQGGYYGVPRAKAVKRAEELLKQLSLWDKKDVLSRSLSGGMKRRLMVARALIHSPRLLILDEPTAGVDIELRQLMWKELKRLNSEGMTIILTTHYLEEAEQLCKNIAVINEGTIQLNTSIRALIKTLDRQDYILELASPVEKLDTHEFITLKEIDKCTLEASLPKNLTLNDLFEFLSHSNIHVTSLRNKSNRLEALLLEQFHGK
jgi:ABC-2 type transport system ATP-binding protein